jgi:hypothetical protein
MQKASKEEFVEMLRIPPVMSIFYGLNRVAIFASAEVRPVCWRGDRGCG